MTDKKSKSTADPVADVGRPADVTSVGEPSAEAMVPAVIPETEVDLPAAGTNAVEGVVVSSPAEPEHTITPASDNEDSLDEEEPASSSEHEFHYGSHERGSSKGAFGKEPFATWVRAMTGYGEPE